MTRSDPSPLADNTQSVDSSPPQPETTPDAHEYNQRAKRGVKLMIGRQVFIQIFTFAGGIVLARTLTPEIFGIFGIATFLVTTLALFGNLGLAPSLIQRKDQLTQKDLQIAFTLQQILLTVVASLVWIVAPYFLRLYPDIGGDEITWLIRVMAITLYLQAWRAMSMLQMERELNYKKVAWIEVTEALSYQGLAVGLALAGFGVWSLVWATLARGVLGTSLAYAASPWRVRLAWDTAKAKETLRFAIPFQTGNIINSAGNWVTPLVVGTMIGPAAVGFLTWAGSLARKPDMITASIKRVAFPHFARCQDDWPEILKAYEKYLWPPLAIGGLWAAMILIAAPLAVPMIYGENWAPAIIALKLFAVALCIGTGERITGIILLSTGKVWQHTRITGMAIAMKIITALILIPILGFIGVPIAFIVTSFAKTAIMLYILPNGVAAVLCRLMTKIALATSIASAIGIMTLTLPGNALAHLATASILITSAYSTSIWFMAPPWIRTKVKYNTVRARLTLKEIGNQLTWRQPA